MIVSGFKAIQFEFPAGAGVEVNFTDFANAPRLVQFHAGGREGLEAFGGGGSKRVIAEKSFDGCEVSFFKCLGDAVDEFRGIRTSGRR